MADLLDGGGGGGGGGAQDKEPIEMEDDNPSSSSHHHPTSSLAASPPSHEDDKSSIPTPGGEEDALLDSLGIKHVEESVASKEIIEKAQSRWAEAAAKAAARMKKKKKPPKSTPSSAAQASTEGVEAQEDAQQKKKKKKKAKKKLDGKLAPGEKLDGDDDEEEAGGGGGGGKGSTEDGDDDGTTTTDKRRTAMREVIADESYQVRIGDLTPFEEAQLAEERKQAKKKARADAAAGASSGGGGGSSSAGAAKMSSASLSAQRTPTGPPRGHKQRQQKKSSRNSKTQEQEARKEQQKPISKKRSLPSSSAAAAAASSSMPESQSPSIKRSEADVDDGSEHKAQPEDKKKKKKKKVKTPTEEDKGSSSSSKRASSSSLINQFTVECPVCGRQVPVKDKERPDAELSEHLDRCMRRGSSRGGGSTSPIMIDNTDDEKDGIIEIRRSTRKRRRLVDDDDDDEEDDEEGMEEKKASSSSSSSRPGIKKEEMDFIDEESDDEEEEYDPVAAAEEWEGDDDDDEEEGKEDRKPAAKKTTSSANKLKDNGGRQRPRGALLIDDFANEDYQRRIAEYEAALGLSDGESDEEEDGQQARNRTQARNQGLGDEDAGPLELPGGFSLSARVNRRLYWYQRTGVRWLWELYRQGAGGILGDEMGLGKTVQLSAFLGGLRRSGSLRSALIIAPATLMSQWASEVFAWAPRLRVVILHRSCAAFAAQPAHKVSRFVKKAMALDGVVCITTYESLKLLRNELLNHHWSYVALDEGQKIRNPDAEVTACAKQLATVHRIILSGTPIQNNLKELWSLFDFCFPGRLGTLPAFETELATPIRIGGYSNATPTQAQLAYRCALVLRDLIHPYLLRRMKKDIMQILPMPKKTEQVLFCKLTARQRNLYRAAISSPEIRLILDGKASHFRAITILRKICNHADLAAGPDSDGRDIMSRLVTGGGWDDEWEDEEDDDDPALAALGLRGGVGKVASVLRGVSENDYGAVSRSGKMQVLAEVLPRWQVQGHRVLLFSQTRQMLDILERLVKQNGWRYLRMDGNTSVGSRPALIDRFNADDSIFVFLLTTRTGGLGISLTGADRVILYDPDWNPQTDIQARERAWRLGQKRPVTIYRLVTSGTIEEKIYQRQIFKTAITNRVLQDPKQKRLFSSGELKELFTLKEDFDDEDATNDTADVFMEGVVKRSSLPRKKRKKARRTQEEEEDDDGEIREAGRGGGSAIVAMEEDRRAPADYAAIAAATNDGDGMEGLGRMAEEEVQQEDDDCKILKAVFNGKGLASVLSHDVVEEGKKNMDLWIQMQDQAQRIADRAATMLRESSASVQAAHASSGGSNRFVPTWTGRTGRAGQAAPPRFGPRATPLRGGGGEGAAASSGGGGGKGRAAVPASTTTFGLGQRAASSSTDILSRFREREGENHASPSSSAAAGQSSSISGSEEARYVSLLDRIKRFLRDKGPRVPTADLLQHFRNVPNSDAVIFKTMLKECATLSRGAWTLKEGQ